MSKVKLSSVANSTAGNAVYREDGLRLYGLDAEIQLRVQQKRDAEWEKSLMGWIEQVTGEKCAYPDDIIESLRSGVLLCKVINVLEPGTIKRIDTRDIALVYVENINNYLKACWKFGMSSSDLFVTSDLSQKKGVAQVITNVWALIRLAQSRPDWKGPVLGPIQKHGNPVRKWDPVQTKRQSISVEELEKQEEEFIKNTVPCPICHERILKDAKFCKICGTAMPGSDGKPRPAMKQYSELEKEVEKLRLMVEKEKAERLKLVNENEFLKKQLESANVPLPKDEQAAKILQLETELKNEKNSKIDLELKVKEEQQKQLKEKVSKNQWKEKYYYFLSSFRHQSELTQPDVEQPIESDLMLLTQETVKKVINSEPMEFEDCFKLNALFPRESGRRFFVRTLKSAMKSTASYALDGNSFELLLYLFNTTLLEMDKSNSKDFITAKKLMKTSSIFHRFSDNSTTEFIRDFIKEHQIWNDLRFWQEVFLDDLFKKHRKHFPDKPHVERDFLSTLICSFVLNMKANWNIPTDMLEFFIKNVVYSNEFGIEDPKSVEAETLAFLNSNTERDVKEAKKRRATSVSNVKKTEAPTEFIEPIIKQAYLLKKGANGRWKKRWCVARYGKIEYSKHEKEKAKAVSLKNCKVDTLNNKPFGFVIISTNKSQRDYMFQAASEPERKLWIEALTACVVKQIVDDKRKAVDPDATTAT